MKKCAVLIFFSLLFVGCQKKDKEMGIATRDCFWLSRAAVLDYSLKANEGDASAAFVLYQYYLFSINNSGKAHEWLVRSAELGHPIAQHNLAMDLEKTNKLLARHWYAKAAESGLVYAQYHLAMNILANNPSPKDSEEAKTWLIKVASSKNEDDADLVQDAQKELQSMMNESDIP